MTGRDDIELRRYGLAIAWLRREVGLSQAEAGACAGLSSQNWGQYEQGKRKKLFRPEVQLKLVSALGRAPTDFRSTLARITDDDGPAPLPQALAEEGRPFVWDQRPNSAGRDRITVDHGNLEPWAGPGVILEFDYGQRPNEGQGCVVDLSDGSRMARVYAGCDEEHVFLLGGPGGLGTRLLLDHAMIRRIAKVTARLEPD